jgi:xanthine dehydrogenase YagR molybdenum-binding subunit
MIEMSSPMGATPLDQDRDGMVGKPLDRVDGPLKVSGRATYAYEFAEEGTVFGFIRTASISKGKIKFLDSSRAEKAPGVLLVLNYKNVPDQGKAEENKANPQFADNLIHHFGQPVAFVVADTFEKARSAAALIEIEYDEEEGSYELAKSLATARKPEPLLSPPDSELGDFDSAFRSVPVQIDATYTTPSQSHAMMEPHATLALWNGDKLTVYTANQMIMEAQESVAKTFNIPTENVRIISRYIGGGFGGKLHIRADVVLPALAARKLNRPVKVALTRPQVFNLTTRRSETIQRLRLGADRQGTISAIGHEVWCGNLPQYKFYEMAADQTQSIYAGPNRMTAHRLSELDLVQSDSMRAPGEAVGMLALECAMDELAVALKMDPIELRIRNEPTEDPQKKIPFSTRKLVACMREGAQRFGWTKRNPVPAQTVDGNWLVGMGMSAAYRRSTLQDAQCEIALFSDGSATLKTAMTDIGTGSYTIFTQLISELLGIPPQSVRVEMGDTSFPKAPGSGGSWGAGSVGSAIYDACIKLRAKLSSLAGIDTAKAQFAHGIISGDGKSVAFSTILPEGGLTANGELKKGDMLKQFSQASYGAIFVEVGVDRDTGETRIRRMLGVFDAGRILNEKTARSQLIGGMVFGIGAALTEEMVLDPRYGCFVNHDLAEYHLPVHADVPAIEAFMLPGSDDKSNPIKTKGIGELGISGAGAAIANAIYNACGVRIRDYPMTLDKILPHLSTTQAA